MDLRIVNGSGSKTSAEVRVNPRERHIAHVSEEDLRLASLNPWGLTGIECSTLRVLSAVGRAKVAAKQLDVPERTIESRIRQIHGKMRARRGEPLVSANMYVLWTEFRLSVLPPRDDHQSSPAYDPPPATATNGWMEAARAWHLAAVLTAHYEPDNLEKKYRLRARSQTCRDTYETLSAVPPFPVLDDPVSCPELGDQRPG